MNTILKPRAIVVALMGLLLSIFAVSAQAMIAFGTITFDDGTLGLPNPPYVETAAGVQMTLTSSSHLHFDDRGGDSTTDLWNHLGITQTFTFSQPVSILSFDVVEANSGGLGAGNSFASDAGGSFSVSAVGMFDVAANGVGVWQDITSFSWTQPTGELSIDNLDFSTVPIPAAFWLTLSGLAGLSRFARQRK